MVQYRHNVRVGKKDYKVDFLFDQHERTLGFFSIACLLYHWGLTLLLPYWAKMIFLSAFTQNLKMIFFSLGISDARPLIKAKLKPSDVRHLPSVSSVVFCGPSSRNY